MAQLILHLLLVVFNPGPPIEKTENVVREFIECSEPILQKCSKDVYNC